MPDAILESTNVPVSAPSSKGSFSLSDSAAIQLKRIAQQKSTPEGGMRLAVKGGGCSGFSYAMDWADKPTEKERVFERDGARVFIDGKSLLVLTGAELVFEESFMAAMFKVKNPNAKATCGCGESFAV